MDPINHEKLASTRNSMAVTELIINHLCDQVHMANQEKTLKKKLPSRIVGEVGTYTTCIGKMLSNPDHRSNSEVDREGALEPPRPQFS